MNELPRNQILPGDARRVLPTLLPASVDAAITSPPYFALRDYGTDAQIGQEPAVDAWVGELRAICRLLARVLKPHGSLWLNVSDTYARRAAQGAPRKSLLAGPERLLTGLLADGWLCRNKVVWAKTSALPQSARDRLSPTYEVLYHLVRQPDYFYDLDAIRVPHRSRPPKPQPSAVGRAYQGGNGGLAKLAAAGRVGALRGKNPGDVWTLPSGHFRGAHFATFPEALVERPLLATVPERICVQCDQAWRRDVRIVTVHTAEGRRSVRKVGALARCDCFAPARPGLVLDCFFGSGTVGAVATRHDRDWLGIELNPSYRALAARRLGIARAA